MRKSLKQKIEDYMKLKADRKYEEKVLRFEQAREDNHYRHREEPEVIYE
jgi:hypothetical protein